MTTKPTIQIEDPFADRPVPTSNFALFNYGFRTFFWLTGVFGAFSIPVWVALFAGHGDFPLIVAPAIWHGHEMLFGFAASAIAGFLLTVVPNWTKVKARKGGILMVLAALWVAGRVAYWGQAALPYGLVMILDLAFMAALTGLVLRPLTNPQHRRQFVFVPILALLVVANALTHLAGLGVEAFGVDWGLHGLTLGLDAVVLLITIMGGRVTPSFTSSYLGHQDPNVRVQQRPKLDRVVILSTWAMLVMDQVLPETMFAAAVTLIAAVAHGWRLSGWQGLRTLSNPILWVLHLGYAWLIVGLVIKALGDVGFVRSIDALHALTIGAVGTIVIAIMTRASLGHTGRVIKAPPSIVVAYVLISVSAIVRTLVVVLPEWSGELIMVSGAAWSLAYLAFVVVYTPILMRPRIDGRPG